jgi:hypothetical protein
MEDQTTAGYCSFYQSSAGCRSVHNVTALECVPACMKQLHCAAEYCSIFSMLSALCGSSSSSVESDTSAYIPVIDAINDNCEQSVYALSSAASTTSGPFVGNTSVMTYIIFNISLDFGCADSNSSSCASSAVALANDTMAMEGMASSLVSVIPGTSVSSVLPLLVNDNEVVAASAVVQYIREDSVPPRSSIPSTIWSMATSWFSGATNHRAHSDINNQRRSLRSSVDASLSPSDPTFELDAATTTISVKFGVIACLSCITRYNNVGNSAVNADDYFDDDSGNHTTTSTSDAFDTLASLIVSNSSTFADYWSVYAGPGYCAFNDNAVTNRYRWCTSTNVPILDDVEFSFPDGMTYTTTTDPSVYRTVTDDTNTDDTSGGGSGGENNNAAIIGGVVGGTAGAAVVGSVAYRAILENANSIRAPMSAAGDFDIPAEGF